MCEEQTALCVGAATRSGEGQKGRSDLLRAVVHHSFY